jgi:hypothetical protein
VSDVSFVLRDRRDDVTQRWTVSLAGAVSDEYREVLESPIGARLVRKTLEDLLSYTEAEEYAAAATLRRIEEETASEAARRAALGFELTDLLAARHALRATLWDVLIDALVVGDLPSPGETMQQMKGLDMFLDALSRSEVAGYLAGRSGDATGAAVDPA